MTTLDFHIGLADKLGYACRLVRKAWRGGNSVVVTGSGPELARLDALLWVFETDEFVPHARLRAGEAIAPRLARTPVWLAEQPADAGSRAVLVNLGPRAVADAPAYARVVELVGEGDDELAQGRERWRAYKAAGLAPRQAGATPSGGA